MSTGRSWIWVAGCVGLISLLMTAPGPANAITYGPGQDRGGLPTTTNNLEKWYQTGGTEDWGAVFGQVDGSPPGEWTCGMTIENLRFRDYQNGGSPPDAYDNFIKELTMPWVNITWASHNPTVCQFDDYNGNDNGKLQLTSFSFTEGNRDSGSWVNGIWFPPGITTTFLADYDLDADSGAGNVVDFSFQIQVILETYNPNNNNVATGRITYAIRVTFVNIVNGNNWQVNWNDVQPQNLDTVQSISFAFICNPQMSGPSDDYITYWDGNNWQDADSELGPIDTSGLGNPGNIAYFTDGFSGHSMTVIQNFPGQKQPTSADIWCLLRKDEYSQYPDSYDGGESFDGEANELIWYVQSFTTNGMPINGAFTGIQLDGLLA